MAAQFAVWWSQLDCYEAAFRTGEGLAWGAFPAAHAEGMDMITRAVVIPALVAQWLPASDGIVARLWRARRWLMWAAGTVPRASPWRKRSRRRVHRLRYRRRLGGQGPAGAWRRERPGGFVRGGRAAGLRGGPYDLVTFIDSLHDLGDPVGALRRARQVLADDGMVLLADTPGPAGWKRTSIRPAGSSTPLRRWCASPMRWPTGPPSRRSARSPGKSHCGGWRTRRDSAGYAAWRLGRR